MFVYNSWRIVQSVFILISKLVLFDTKICTLSRSKVHFSLVNDEFAGKWKKHISSLWNLFYFHPITCESRKLSFYLKTNQSIFENMAACHSQINEFLVCWNIINTTGWNRLPSMFLRCSAPLERKHGKSETVIIIE